MNTLYYGDNLEILKNSIKDETIDLIYLDPPFQSGKDYNIIFKPEKEGIKGATSQIKTFEDTWNWGQEASNEYMGLVAGALTTYPPSQKLIDLMEAMKSYLGGCSLFAYLSMMAPRLLELKRVLKPTGSIYLHCDPTASHYLKMIMDSIFGNFKNEIIWSYKRYTAASNRFQRLHDVILFYGKTSNSTWNDIRDEYGDKSGKADSHYKQDEDGRWYRWQKRKGQEPYIIYLSEGRRLGDVWDIPIINASSKERTGYPTQKPEALLERIIQASSFEGDTVLDPFCGCGTAVAVSERLNRNWIGIDISYLSIDVIKKRFLNAKILPGKDFKIKGVPQDVYSATKLAEKEPFQFEVWAVSQLNATPTVKSGDKGVDGVINFIDHTNNDKLNKGIISVKGGHNIIPAMVRELIGTVQSHKAAFGILITTEKPTKGMVEVAASEGNFNYSYTKGVTQTIIPKIQLISVEDLFCDPIKVKLPPNILDPFNKPDIKKNPIFQDEIEM